MIKSILIALCTVLLCWNSIPAEAQTPQDSVRFIGYLPVRHTDPTKWITRYQSEIDRYQTENQMLKDTSCDVLFLGSSSINLWDNIYRDMAPLKILGSACEVIFYVNHNAAGVISPGDYIIIVEHIPERGTSVRTPENL